MRLNNSRESLFVPDILVPCAWQTAILDQPTIMYKVSATAELQKPKAAWQSHGYAGCGCSARQIAVYI